LRVSRVGTVTLGILLSSTVVGGLFGGKALAGPSRMAEHLRVYSALIGAIEQSYVEDVKSDRLVAYSIREMLRTLDPHSNFLETKEYSTLQERQKGSYYGLGITVQSVDGNITVVSPFEGTPAFRLGIRAGDIISKIEDEDARGLSIDDAVKRLRGPKGSTVRVTIVRQGYSGPLEFTVIRDQIPLHSVPYSFMATPKTGYVRLQDFNETTACRPFDGPECKKELETALGALEKQGATTFILDIRDNPGGLLDQAFAVSNLFLRKGQLVVYTRGRTKRDESNYVTEAEGRFSKAPLVVLVSRHSASASEIVAGALQDHDRALIVGETTFGKGLVQTIMPLRNVRGYALALTTARYYTPSGRSIQRDYDSTALEDYVAPRDRKLCDQTAGDAKLTDAGRKVFGGDGIAPDYCVEPEPTPKLLSRLVTRQAFLGFSHRFESAEVAAGAEIVGTGSRSGAGVAEVRRIGRDFVADAQTLEAFREYLRSQKISFDEAEFQSHKDAIARRIQAEVLLQAFGEGEARRRTLNWDVQVRKALETVPKAEQLLRDPQRFVAEREAEKRIAQAGERH
jgi:carboxyl-terminal processing protease